MKHTVIPCHYFKEFIVSNIIEYKLQMIKKMKKNHIFFSAYSFFSKKEGIFLIFYCVKKILKFFICTWKNSKIFRLFSSWNKIRYFFSNSFCLSFSICKFLFLNFSIIRPPFKKIIVWIFIVCHKIIWSSQNLVCAPVIFTEKYYFRFRIIFLEINYIFRGTAVKTIYGLIFIAHYA